jgi:hypothetical protein
MTLFERIAAWVSNAWNWLNRFFKRLWGWIKGWWSKLKTFIVDALKEFIEVVILDRRQQGGRELWDLIQKEQPKTHTIAEIDNLDSKVALSINSDGTIGKVENLDAQAQERDQYDVLADENNGIIRING